MSPNSEAYRNACARVRKAIAKELFNDAEPSIEEMQDRLSRIKKVEYLLDDLAGVAVRSAFGIETSE